jgi:DNA-binding transcriptional LysR family regulator
MAVKLDIDCLRNFIAIANAGALSRAAEHVGRTQAALSQQVLRLETIIRQPLLVRSGRGVALTVYGDRLLDHAQKIVRTHDEAASELLGVSLSGKIRFGCPDDYARVFLPHLLQSFGRLHPQVLVEVVCAPTYKLLEELKDQALEIALVSLPDSPQREQFLRRERFVWVGTKGGDAYNRDPLQLALSDPENLDHQAAISSLDRMGRKYRIAYASASAAGLMAVVRSGQAVAVLTRTAVPSDLQVLPHTSGLPKLPSVGITVKTSRRNSSKLVSHFESHIRSVLPTL